MKKQLFTLILILISCINAYSQIIFQEGYFINESNRKIDCLIKDVDWKYNPTEFEYKLLPSNEVQTASIGTVKEFGIKNSSKYIRAKVKIDQSSNLINELSHERDPDFKEELLFLKVLIEGQVFLFQHVRDSSVRFFYKKNDSEISQLIHKEYFINNKISENNSFRQQLFTQLKCEEIGLRDLEHLEYNKKSLERLFIKYNECIGFDYINYKPKQKRDLFNLTFRPRLDYTDLKVQNMISDFKDTDFESTIGVRFGIETEFILPFNKNKWGVIIESTYQNYKSEQSKEINGVSGGTLLSKINYQSIGLSTGLRHYFFLNDQSKLFANISNTYAFSNNSHIKFLRQDDSIVSELDIMSGGNWTLGIGYKHNDKYSIEIQYNSSREILRDYAYWDSKYNSLSIIFGVSFF
jgi:hypothetical protein